MDSEEDIVIIIFMNSSNAVHTITALKMDLLQQQQKFELADESRNCISSLVQTIIFFKSLDIFFATIIVVLSLVFFSEGCFFPAKRINSHMHKLGPREPTRYIFSD